MSEVPPEGDARLFGCLRHPYKTVFSPTVFYVRGIATRQTSEPLIVFCRRLHTQILRSRVPERRTLPPLKLAVPHRGIAKIVSVIDRAINLGAVSILVPYLVQQDYFNLKS